MLDLLVLLVFLAVLVTIGKWAAGRVHTSLDFHLCGRRLGRLPVAFSLAATEFSGSGLVGGAGLAYTVGVAGVYWNYSAVPAWIILGFTVAIAFRRLALYTVPEFLGQRFGQGGKTGDIGKENCCPKPADLSIDRRRWRCFGQRFPDNVGRHVCRQGSQ